MRSDDYLALIGAIDGLYERVVMDPASLGEADLAEWAEDNLRSVGGDKRIAREVRRALRTAQKLQAYWSARSGDGPADWRSRVDEKAGTRAWEPGLAIAQLGLEADPGPALFNEVKRLVAEVRFDRWMDGVGYEEWLTAHRAG